tara:strand:- start:28 stop:252 length:225 start_codon:yes stop_codon:yes gene_type:complete
MELQGQQVLQDIFLVVEEEVEKLLLQEVPAVPVVELMEKDQDVHPLMLPIIQVEEQVEQVKEVHQKVEMEDQVL